jgi:hypothetical protein
MNKSWKPLALTGLGIALAAAVAACSPEKPTSMGATATRTPVSRKTPRLSAQQRLVLREWFQTASSVISAPADSAHGISLGMAEHADDDVVNKNDTGRIGRNCDH